jgi:hypothetical protein
MPPGLRNLIAERESMMAEPEKSEPDPAPLPTAGIAFSASDRLEGNFISCCQINSQFLPVSPRRIPLRPLPPLL